LGRWVGIQGGVQVDFATELVVLDCALKVLDRLVDGVGLEEHQLACLDKVQGVFDRFFPSDKVVDFFDPFARIHTSFEDRGDLAWFSASKVLVFVEDDTVEVIGKDFTLAYHVDIASIACGGVDDRTVTMGELFKGFDDRQEARTVVSIIGDDRRAVNLQEIEATGDFVHMSAERFEASDDLLDGHSDAPASRDARKNVLDLELDPTLVGQWDLIKGRQRRFLGTFSSENSPIANKDDALSFDAMIGQDRIVFIDCKEDHPAFAFLGHFGGEGIVGFEDSESVFVHGLDDASLDLGELFDRLDIGESKMVSFAYVGNDPNVAKIEPEAFAEDTSACCLEHCGFYKGIHQNGSSALWTAAVTRIDAPSSDVDSVGTGHPDFLAGAGHEVGDQSCRSGLAVDPCDADDRNTAVAGPREHHIDDRFADGPWLA
jgi:hypothetical protein